MKIALITCTRNKESHLLEFLDHYKEVDTIFLCDNNDIGTNKLEPFIKDNVIYVDYRGVPDVQHVCYSEIVNKYRSQYDYYCVFDDDEFIGFKSSKGIKDFLSQDNLKDADVIKIPWIYKLLPLNKIINFNTSEYSYKKEMTYIGLAKATQTKSIIRYRNDLIRINPHYPVFKYVYVVKDCNGLQLNNAIDILYRFPFYEESHYVYVNKLLESLDAYLIHYMHKTKEEYFNKMIGLRASSASKKYYTLYSVDKLCSNYFKYYHQKDLVLEELFKLQFQLRIRNIEKSYSNNN